MELHHQAEAAVKIAAVIVRRRLSRRNFASRSRIKSKSRKVASSVPVRVLLSQIAFPTRAPIPAVSAIANAPQKVTLIVGLRASAPPALAPTIPSEASPNKKQNRGHAGRGVIWTA